MSKYWGKQIFVHGRLPEVGQNQKTERERRWRTQARMAHASRLAQKRRKFGAGVPQSG